MTEDEVKDYCRQSLAPYKVPTQVEFINELHCELSLRSELIW